MRDVLGILKIKGLLIGALLSAPGVGLWMLREAPVAEIAPATSPQTPIRVPVEVIEKGSAPEWVYVQVGNQAVPEPGAIMLVLMTGTLLAFRRQRA